MHSLHSTYHMGLVLLSILMAIVASYTALDLAVKSAAGEQSARSTWLLFASVAIGLGIWSTHFIGMLALDAGITLSFTPLWTAASMAIAVAIAGLALFVAARLQPSRTLLLLSGTLMGLGILAMHHAGMAAVRAPSLMIHHDGRWIVLSVIFAACASTLALRLTFAASLSQRVRRHWHRIAGSLSLGAAIAGLHYINMAAADFRMAKVPGAAAVAVPDAPYLGLIIGFATCIILGFALLCSFFDRQAQSLALRLNRTLKEANARLEIGVAERTSELQREMEIRQASEQSYRSIFEQAAVGIAHADLEGRIVRANQRYCAITGYTLAELCQMRFHAIVHPDDLDRNLELRLQLLSGEIDSFAMEKRLLRKNGSIAWVKLTGSRGYEAGSGQPGHTITIIEDITAQKNAEYALRQSQERLALAVEAAGLGNWEIDLDRGELWCSDNVAKMLGRDAAGNIISLAAFLEQVHPEDQPLVEAAIQAAMRGEATGPVDHRVTGADGQVRWLSGQGRSVLDANGHCTHVIGVSFDITGRKQAEQTLRQLSSYLQRAREDERTRIAREIHDEIGGTLTAIKYDLSVFHRRDDPDTSGLQQRNQRTVQMVDGAIASLRRIITDLRPSILDHLGLLAALEWQAQDFSQRTGIPCAYRLSGGECGIDPERATALFRMVQEVLTNVLRHAQATQVRMNVLVRPQSINIRIQDNGVGIARCRLHGTASYGLLGMRERARHFNGTVRITGKPDSGTTVNIRLPLSADTQGVAASEPALSAPE